MRRLGLISSLLLASSLFSCATFNIAVGRNAETGQYLSKEQVAGATLACAANAQRTAIWEGLFSVVASSAAGLLATLTPAANPSDQQGLSIASAIASGISLGFAISAGFEIGKSVVYLERSGMVLAGQETEGCHGGAPLPSVASEPHETLPTVRRTPTPSAIQTKPSERCSEKDLSEMRTGGMSEGAIQQACSP